MSMLHYEFMRKALLAAFLLALVIPCVGVIAALRRFSLIGDALSHASLAGVAGGLALGVNPVAGAAAVSVLAALCVERLRARFGAYGDTAIAAVMSASLGLAGVLSSFAPQGFSAFLFGSIVAISGAELALTALACAAGLAVFLLLYRDLFAIASDERQARLSGVRVGAVNAAFTVLTACLVSAASRAVGALAVTSLMALPAACALRCARSFRQTVLLAAVFGEAFALGGTVISWYTGVRPGGAAALLGAGALTIVLTLTRKEAL